MIDAILSRAADGGRISPDEAVLLYRDAPLEELGAAADAVVQARYGDRITYNVNAHLNPTNICVVGCGFCAFAVWTEKDERAYAYSVDQLVERAEPALGAGHHRAAHRGRHDQGVRPRLLRGALHRAQGDAAARLAHGADRGRGRLRLAAVQGRSRRGHPAPAGGGSRHHARRRRGGLQPARAQDHRRPQGAGRGLARGPPRGARPGHAHQRDPPVRALRDARGAGRPHAPAARAAGRDGRLPGLHPAALPAGQHRLRLPARAVARGEAAHDRRGAPVPRLVRPHQGPLGDAGRGDHVRGAALRPGRPLGHAHRGADRARHHGPDAPRPVPGADGGPHPRRRQGARASAARSTAPSSATRSPPSSAACGAVRPRRADPAARTRRGSRRRCPTPRRGPAPCSG